MKILLGVDGSEYSRAAIDAVASRPWPDGSIIRVMSSVDAVPPTAVDMVLTTANTQGQLLDDLRAQANGLVQEITDRLKAAGLNAEGVVRTGEPRSTIVDEAQEWPADLVIVGSHGRTGLKRWLLGSVAQSVVAHAPCSVEVVRRR